LLGPIPDHWIPGTHLELRGPLGKGFQLPASGQRIGLASLGNSPARLLPLIPGALQTGCDLVLFSKPPYPELPSAVEIQPVAALPEILTWADLLLLILPAEALPHLRRQLNLEPHQPLPSRIQALIDIPMPCAGLGECGACAITARRGYHLACLDGPVFDLTDLDW
jgi:NAD(P)H-flavin reductase